MYIKRIEWIDICKGLGMLLVVIGHTSIAKISQLSYDWIYSFHMPLFYFLSGLCYNTEKYNNFIEFIKRRWKTLILPFFTLNFIIFIPSHFMKIEGMPATPWLHLFTGVSAMYFVRVLFISELWYFFFCKILHNTYIRLVFVCLVVVGVMHIEKGFSSWSMLLPGMPLFYYALGNVMRKWLTVINCKVLYAASVIILSVSISMILLLRGYLYGFIPAFSGIITLMTLSMLIDKRLANNFKCPIIAIGVNTLPILAFHPLLYNGLKYLTSFFLFSNLADAIFRILLMTLLLWFISILLRKHVPWMIGK